MKITLDIPDTLTHYDACRALGAINYEIRAAQHVAWKLPGAEAQVLRRRCARLYHLVPVVEQLVQALQPQLELFPTVSVPACDRTPDNPSIEQRRP